MRLVGVFVFALLSSAGTPSPPVPHPLVAPPEAWVAPAVIPPPPATAAGAATVALLFDIQARFTDSGDTTYLASVYKIASAQGLDSGSLQINWDPALEALTLHRYRIIRDGKVIDLLGDGSNLSVMRREKNMENAVLDGRLTVSYQPEDLRVGDVIDLAYSLTRKDPVMAGKSEGLFGPDDGVPFGRVRVRALWPDTKKVRWRSFPGAIQPKLIRTAQGNELVADIANATTSRAPQGAPPRFRLINAVELTEFPDWASVSRTLAPYYDPASRIAANGPLATEVARIAATTSDPRRRTELALRLVQDQVRYLFLGMDDGGYVPTAADITWSRRFGDCKAKTALLVAMLNALGINARPVLVNTERGDLVAERLPFMAAFDHAIVEARIGDRSYWLDGTRSGDARLDQLRAPNYHVGLPIVPGGTGLESIAPPALDQPDEVTSLRLDARDGIAIPAPATGEMRFRGENATSMRVKYANLSQTDLEQALRKLWRDTYDFVDPATVATREEAATGDFIITMSGSAKMDWFSESDTRWYEADRSRLGWKLDITRDGQVNPDAPFAFDYPDWWASNETILLPNGGKGFTLQADPIDETVGGLYTFHRTATIRDGVMTMTADTRALSAELPASKAADTRAKMMALRQRGVFVRVPDDYMDTDRELAALKDDKPGLAKAYMHRAALRTDREELDGALADADAALAIDPKLAFAHTIRAMVLAKTQDSRANEAAERAIALDPKQWLAWRAKSINAINQQKWADAITAASADIAINKDDANAMVARATGNLELGHPADALTDIDAALTIDPKLKTRQLRAQALSMLGRRDEALAEADRAVAAEPDSIPTRSIRVDIRMRFGQVDGALDDLTVLIAKRPSAALYAARARLWPDSDQTHRLADVETALKLDPKNVLALVLRAHEEMQVRDFALAQADLKAAAKIEPTFSLLRSVQVDLLVKQGLKDDALHVLDAAIAQHPKDAMALNERCWFKATRDIQLTTALADCEAALQIAPDSPGILDSRAFLKLRTGSIDGAIADYDAALRLAPRLAASLYGRGIAHARRGEAMLAKADLDRARAISPDIEGRFAEYGMTVSGTN